MYSLLTPVAVLVMSQLHQHRPHPLLLYQVKAWLSLQNLQSEHRGPLKCQSCCLVALSLETNISRRQNLYGHDPASQTIPVSFRHPCHPDIDFTLADCSDNVSWTHSSRRDTCRAISIISWGWRGGERGKPPRSPDWPTCAVRYSARAKLKHKWSSNFLFLPALNFSFVSMRDWIWRAQENANSICWYTFWFKAFKKTLFFSWKFWNENKSWHVWHHHHLFQRKSFKMSYEASVMEQAMETARKRVLESYDEDG